MVFQVIGAIVGAAVLYLCTTTSGEAIAGTGANACQPGVELMGALLAAGIWKILYWDKCEK